jgi:Cu/Ag efflux protein CusF
MRTNRFAIFATTLLLMALALNLAAAAADQHSGTWKMNPAKSKYSPGPAPKSATVKIDSEADNIKLSSDGIDAAGNPTHIEYTAKYDGKDYPITGVPNADTVALERPDASTIRSTIKKGDQVVMTVTSVISKDGTMRTSTFRGKDPQGQDVNNVVVYDKQ